jgi:hypothetical protein
MQRVKFSQASLETFGIVMVFASFSPTIVKFRPYFVRFEPSDVYGAGPFATARHWRMLSIVQATIEDQTNAEVPGDATTFTLYIPDFVQEYSLSGKAPDK